MNQSPNDTLKPVFIPPCSVVALAVCSPARPPFCLLLLTNMMRGLSKIASLLYRADCYSAGVYDGTAAAITGVGSSRRLSMLPAIDPLRGLTF